MVGEWVATSGLSQLAPRAAVTVRDGNGGPASGKEGKGKPGGSKGEAKKGILTVS